MLEPRCKKLNIPRPGPRIRMQASAKQFPYERKYINELRGPSKRTSDHHTCFQRKPCIPNPPPPSRRERSKPTRTMTSNRMSMTSVTMRAILKPLRSFGAHTRLSGNHTKRTCTGNKREPEMSKNGHHPYYSCTNMPQSLLGITNGLEPGRGLALEKEGYASHP
jgi:hypothetical protein